MWAVRRSSYCTTTVQAASFLPRQAQSFSTSPIDSISLSIFLLLRQSDASCLLFRQVTIHSAQSTCLKPYSCLVLFDEQHLD